MHFQAEENKVESSVIVQEQTNEHAEHVESEIKERENSAKKETKYESKIDNSSDELKELKVSKKEEPTVKPINKVNI